VANYDRHILEVLVEAGVEGLSVQKISRHVFNACNTFFDSISFDDVHSYVQYYLLKNSRNSNSFIERLSSRGIYRLNPSSGDAQQLKLQFSKEPEETQEKTAVDHSLSLFD